MASHLFALVLTLTLLATSLYPAKSLLSQEQQLNGEDPSFDIEEAELEAKSMSSQEHQLNDEGVSFDIEEAEVLLKELEDLVEEEVMANNNGGDDDMALLPENRQAAPNPKSLLSQEQQLNGEDPSFDIEEAELEAKSMSSQEHQLNDEGASFDIEEAEVLLKELEDLVEEEVMANNNGGDDDMALLPEKRAAPTQDECRVEVTNRQNCGWWGITEDQCHQRGCCFDRPEEGYWCFHKRGSREYKSLGCWRDTADRAITELEGTDPRLDGRFGVRKNPMA
ncbi:uncharacterized protein, partial [Branchiostoma lanceolatum]|uniref:uncharacterized protein n=1 Tax=Branchiostoma lanceolatum TaxID=7740 RepID=UPI0034546A27